MKIVKKECPSEFDTYIQCTEANSANLDKCNPLR